MTCKIFYSLLFFFFWNLQLEKTLAILWSKCFTFNSPRNSKSLVVWIGSDFLATMGFSVSHCKKNVFYKFISSHKIQGYFFNFSSIFVTIRSKEISLPVINISHNFVSVYVCLCLFVYIYLWLQRVPR